MCVVLTIAVKQIAPWGHVRFSNPILSLSACNKYLQFLGGVKRKETLRPLMICSLTLCHTFLFNSISLPRSCFFPPRCITVAAGSWREKEGSSGSRIPRLPIRSHEPLHWLDKAVPVPVPVPPFFSLQHLALLLRLPPGCCAL